MGFYYFIILFIGVFLILGAALQAFKHLSLLNKRVIFLGSTGVLLIGLSIFLFTPGSSDVIAEIFGLTN
ncbi:hypothetical protein [Oceanobacillus polygoni]|uniref:Co/Zn/Cd efflux system component n=1 Tax=Oceanobacillus polygoni TaxID=1235259 RepID=A0A9X0YU91_9BACI|nr:hypothetical protein [Oceanobacillus polygoni]MBP2078427.1 Co/Zn/Cd efflux system component [Oceanobacillus polygoni]